MPDVFDQYFTPNGEMKNGIDLISTAIALIKHQLIQGDLSALFVPLLVNLFSLLTSIFSIHSMYFFVTSKDFQEATDPRKIAFLRKSAQLLNRKAHERLELSKRS